MKPIPMNAPVDPQLNVYHLKLLVKSHLMPNVDYNRDLVVIAECVKDARRQASTVARAEGKDVWLKTSDSSCRKMSLAIPAVVCVNSVWGRGVER